MKFFNLILITFVLLTACAPDVPPPSAEDHQGLDPQDELIKALDQKKQAIDKLLANAELRHDSLAFECESVREGGRLSFFKKGDEIRLLRHAYYNGDQHGGIISAYVENGQLFYAHVEEGSWSSDQEAPQEEGVLHTREDNTEYTYYFDEAGTPIRCLQKSYVIRSAVQLPLELEKIKADEIGCGGAKVLQAFFNRVKDVETVGALVDILCTDG